MATSRAAFLEAYALIRDDLDQSVSPGEVLAQARRAQEIVDAARAVQTHRLAQHAGTVTHDDHSPDGEHTAARGVARVASWVDARRFADVAAELQWGPRTAATRCRDAVTAIHALPGLVDVLAEGGIDRERLAAVVEACRDVPEEHLPHVGPMVEHAMLEGARGGIRSWTATRTRSRARATVAAVEAFAPARHRARSVRDAVGVTFEPGRVQGTSVVTATLSTQHAPTIKAAIEHLAWTYETTGADQAPSSSGRAGEAASGAAGSGEGDGPNTPVAGATDDSGGLSSPGECRAQALVDLICANATIETTATVLVPVSTPSQALIGRALDGLAALLADQGLQLSLAPLPDPALAAFGAQTSPDDRLATPAELARFGQEPGSGLAGDLPRQALSAPTTGPPWQPDQDQPAGSGENITADPPDGPAHNSWIDGTGPPWVPPIEHRLSDDPTTRHATLMGELGERVSAVNDPDPGTLTPVLPATPDAATSDGVGEAMTADGSGMAAGCWAAGHPGDVTIDGVGVIHADTVTGLITSFGTRIGRALTDPATGTLREHTTTTAYRPTTGMRRLIHTRDGSCRFPGCTRPTHFTDADHVIPHDQGGPTSPTNLVSLCRTHHRAKASGAWHVALNDDDTLTGTTHTTWPATDPAPF